MSRPHEKMFGDPVFIAAVKEYHRTCRCTFAEAVWTKYKEYWFENAKAATTFDELKQCILDLGERALRS